MEPILCTFILEEGDYTEQQAFQAVALAAVLWLDDEHDHALLEEWFATGHRKHLRRAKPAQFERVLNEVDGGALFADTDGPRVWVSKLHRANETPKLVARQQLSGFKFTAAGEPDQTAAVQVRLNPDLSMSFGKAAVATAHAVQNLSIKLAEEADELLDIWAEDELTIAVERGDFAARPEFAVAIQDHGLTEVPAGSVTAQAFFVDRETLERITA